MKRKEVFEKLRELGIAKVVVEFSGGNDQGGCDRILAYNEDEEIFQDYFSPYSRYDYDRSDWAKEHEELIDALQEPIGYGFINYPNIVGSLTWDTTAETVKESSELDDGPDYDDWPWDQKEPTPRPIRKVERLV